MNQIATIGHNGCPDPIDTISAAYEADRLEAENWLDGSPVENEAQMRVVDQLREAMRQWRLTLERGKKDATAPLHDAYQREGERWKPTIEDAKRYEAGLVSAVDNFKRRLAAEKAEEQRKAHAAAAAARRTAEEAARQASASDIEGQRAAAAAQAEAEEAQRRAAAASKDVVRGLRTVTHHQVTDYRDLLNWIAKNRPNDLRSMIDGWAQRNHKPDPGATGLRVFTEKESF